MKKVFLFASAAIAALAMVSCNKEIETPESLAGEVCPEGYYIEELTAAYPRDPETRTAFNETTGKFAWTEGDELAFHLSNGTYTSAPIDPATSKVKLYLPVGVTRDNYAVYPASAVEEEHASKTDMQVTLPSTYDISDNLTTEFVPMPLIATNDADNKKLKFEHVGALLQVNLNVPAGVKTAKVSMGKQITGTFTLEDGTGNGIIAPGAASSDDGVTFVLSEAGLTEDTEVKLLTPLPSGSYDLFKVAYDNGFEFSKNLSSNPWTFGRSGGKKVSISEENFDDAKDYFYFEALEAGSTVHLAAASNASNRPVLYYSVGNKKSFALWDYSDITLENVGDKVYFYGTSKYFSVKNISGKSNSNVWEGTGKLAVGGELATLYNVSLNPDNILGGFGFAFCDMVSLIDASELVFPDGAGGNCYFATFRGCSNLVEPPKTLGSVTDLLSHADMFQDCVSLTHGPALPALHAHSACYESMFWGCTSLTEAPELPASVVEWESYDGMFKDCKSLTVAPKLDACLDFTLSDCTDCPSRGEPVGTNCYSSMFEGSGLISTPELPATVLSKFCYAGMFRNCTELVDTHTLTAESLPFGAYQSMFEGCVKLVKAPEILATSVEAQAMMEMFKGCTALTEPPSILRPMSLDNYCYSHMFENCKALTVSPVLPATGLALRCYDGMFSSSGLSNPPALPATEMVESCYYQMFYSCKDLVTPPVLSSTTLANGCYRGMFMGSGLQVAPVLPATELAESCYSNMFYNCKSLTSPCILPAQEMKASCYEYMFYNSGLTEAPVLPATVLAKSCYTGMLSGTKIVTSPTLPATELAPYCYSGMFKNCLYLTTVSELPAMVVPDYAYNAMFYKCTSLEAFPALPATELGNSAYCQMFYECSNTPGSVTLPALTLNAYAYKEMFYNCNKLESIDIKATSINFAYSMNKMHYGNYALASIRVAFTEWPTITTANASWTEGVSANSSNSSSRKFYKPESLELKQNTSMWDKSGYIPYMFTVVSYTTEDIGAGL